MSAPMPPDLCVAQLRAAGVNVVEMVVGGVSYKNHNRNSVGPWSDVHGITEHHTGSDTNNPLSYALSVLWPGYSGLPGPLCQISTAPDGTIYMVGWGRCNHAGGGDPNVATMLRNDQIPWNSEVKPRYGNTTPGKADGNAIMYGNEIMYSGGHPMTAAQLRSSAIFDVIVCKYHGWRGNSVIGHREWSSDKPDPGYQDMAAKRRMVDSWIQNGIPGTGTGGSEDMPLTQDDANLVAATLLNYGVPWVEPYTGKVGPAYHEKQSLGNVISWNEEYTARFAKENCDRVIASVQQSITDASTQIAKAIADDPNVDVDPAVIEAAVAKAVQDIKWTTTTEVSGTATATTAPEGPPSA